MNNPIKIGVAGLGHRGRYMAVAMQEQTGGSYQVTALSDPWPHKMQEPAAALKLGAEQCYANLDEMLQRADIEAVLLETGAQDLGPLACAALRAGKHVMADVPMLFTRQDAHDMVAAVRESGKIYCMAEQVRHANFVRQWKRLIAEGTIGEPIFIQGEYIHPLPGWYWESLHDGEYSREEGIDPCQMATDGGHIRTWRNTFRHPIKYISHELSPLLKIIDDRIVEVTCLSADSSMYGDAVSMLDLECALMRTARGRIIRIVNSFTAPRGGEYFHHWYHILGTDGVLENARRGWGGTRDEEIVRRRDARVETTHYGWERDDVPWNYTGGHGGLEAFVFEDFYQTVRHGRPSEADIYATLDCTLPGIIAAESAEAGGTMLKVPDLRESGE